MDPFIYTKSGDWVTTIRIPFKQLAINDPKYSEIFAEAALILSRTVDLKNEDSGQFINLEELSKIDKEKLKNALAPMRRRIN
jgi:CBS domain-containing protein